jgi:magnesium transporter
LDHPLPRFALRRLPASRDGVPPGLLDTVVDWGLYLDGTRCSDVPFVAAIERATAGDGFVWIGVHSPNMRQFVQLGGIFGLHPLAVEDAATPSQRPKLERHDGVLLLSLRTLAYLERDARADGGDVVETGAVMVFAGAGFVLTVRHGRHASLTGLRRRLEADPRHLALGPSAVLHAVTDKVVDDYLHVVDAVHEDIDEIEADVFASRAPTDIERIYQLKRDVIEMKRMVNALARPVQELAERPLTLVHPEIREYFRDVRDHLERVHEQVQSFDELLFSILQAGLARLTVTENEDMRKISAWVAIAAVPTMIAAVYGMNFQYMPELQEPWGYPAVILVMAAICGALYRGFRRSGWL